MALGKHVASTFAGQKRTDLSVHAAKHEAECRYVVAGRQAGEPLQESPYLMHPVECNTVGLYKTPVAILDFASLYPSLYRAHNLCYSTLLHPDDVTGLPPEHTTEVLRPKANVKSHFVKPELRKGILPSILAALIEARATTRASLKEATDAGVILCTLPSVSCCAYQLCLPAVLACWANLLGLTAVGTLLCLLQNFEAAGKH